MCSSLITSSFLDIFGSLFSNGGSSFVDPVYLHMVCVCVCVCVCMSKILITTEEIEIAFERE